MPSDISWITANAHQNCLELCQYRILCSFREDAELSILPRFSISHIVHGISLTTYCGQTGQQRQCLISILWETTYKKWTICQSTSPRKIAAIYSRRVASQETQILAGTSCIKILRYVIDLIILFHFLQVLPYTSSQDIANTFSSDEVFNNLALNTFPAESVQQAPKTLWENVSPPRYSNPDDMEMNIITPTQDQKNIPCLRSAVA